MCVAEGVDADSHIRRSGAIQTAEKSLDGNRSEAGTSIWRAFLQVLPLHHFAQFDGLRSFERICGVMSRVERKFFLLQF